jgi:hypothetical protein
MAVVVVAVTALLKQFAPDWVGVETRPRPAYVFVNLGYSFLAAAAGGCVTAWMAGASPLPAVLGLAVVVLAMGALSTLTARGKQPLWYQAALLAITPLGVLAGGLVRLRALGIL